MPLSDPPTGAAAEALVYYVDLSSNPNFTSNTYVCTFPEGLEFSDQIRGIGDCSFQYSFSALDTEGNVVVSRDFIGPWRSYFRLRCGTDVIMAGPIVSVGGKLGEEFMSVAGKTWEAYFDRWEYPFDPRDGHIYDWAFAATFQANEVSPSGAALLDTGLIYQATNRDIALIAGDILANAGAVPNRLAIDFTELFTPVGVTTHYQMAVGDTSPMSSVLDGLAGTGDGFDWWVGWDKTFHKGSPYRYGSQMAPTISYFLTNTNPPLSLEFDNTGPACTHILGEGAGLASRLGRAYGYAAAQTQYTRLDQSYDFGDIRNGAQLTKKTQKQFSLDLNPTHDIPVEFDPAAITNFWQTFRKGRAIYIQYDLVFHLIDSAQQIKSYTCKVDNEQNAIYKPTLSQIYAVSSTVGTAEG